MKAKYTEPEDARAAFFEFPTASRLAELTQARCREVYSDNWRTPRSVVSIALSSDNPVVFDNGVERASHDGLISNTFGFHPFFGTGHVLRTNGVIAFFWNGIEVAIVELKNIIKLPVLLDGKRVARVSPTKRRLAEAALQD